MNLILELFLVHVEEDGTIAYRASRRDIGSEQANPDEMVNEMIRSHCAPVPWLGSAPMLVHSTSWRYEYDGEIVLTYLACSDRFRQLPGAINRLHPAELHLPPSESPTHPRPLDLREEHVVLHGVRHLRFLLQNTDPEQWVAAISAPSRSVIELAGADTAGKIY